MNNIKNSMMVKKNSMNYRLSSLKSNSGFTLIELVVVIVILGILAATAAPKFMDLQSDARIAYLNGMKGAVNSANQMLHAYAILHGMDGMDLKDSGNSYENAAVYFDGNEVKVADSENKKEANVFFLNYGYIALTFSSFRNSGLVQVIGRDAVDSSKYGFVKTVENVTISRDTDLNSEVCNPTKKDVDICYVSYKSGDKQRTDAYIVLKGFTPSECALHYHAAEKDTQGVVQPPKITLNTSGC